MDRFLPCIGHRLEVDDIAFEQFNIRGGGGGLGGDDAGLFAGLNIEGEGAGGKRAEALVLGVEIGELEAGELGEGGCLGNNDLFKLEGVGGVGGDASGLVEFVGGVGAQNRWSDFVEVADAGDAAGECDGFACFELKGRGGCLKLKITDATGEGVGAVLGGYGLHIEGELVAFEEDGAAFLPTEEVAKEGVGEAVGAAVLAGNNYVELNLGFEDEGAGGDGLDGGAEGGGVEDGAVDEGAVAVDDFPFELAVDSLFGESAADGEVVVGLDAVADEEGDGDLEGFVDEGSGVWGGDFGVEELVELLGFGVVFGFDDLELGLKGSGAAGIGGLNGADGEVAGLFGGDEVAVDDFGAALHVDDAGFGALALVLDVEAWNGWELDGVAFGVDEFDGEDDAVKEADEVAVELHLYVGCVEGGR